MDKLGIFNRDGLLVEQVGTDQDDAYDRLREISQPGDGYEVLLICPLHPDRSAVDCGECWPEGGEDPRGALAGLISLGCSPDEATDWNRLMFGASRFVDVARTWAGTAPNGSDDLSPALAYVKAYRATRAGHRRALLAAAAGMPPQEVIKHVKSGTFNTDALNTLAGLRRIG